MRPVLYVFLGVLAVGSLFQLCRARRGRRHKAAGGHRRGQEGREWDEERGREDYGATARVYE